MDNKSFLGIIELAFKEYLKSGARSNKKLRILHGAIATDLFRFLGKDYAVSALGFGAGKEIEMLGRYMPKRVDITISKNGKELGGIAIKFVMSNYKQNSNNYFENMLGETANIRTANKGYFQILVLPRHLPYFEKDGRISRVEEINEHNMQKYIKLSNDNIDEFLHTPNKTLLYLVDFLNFDISKVYDKDTFANYFSTITNIGIKPANVNFKFGDTIILNDYENFIKKVVAYTQYLG